MTKTTRRKISIWWAYLFVSVVLFLTIFPVFWIVVLSFAENIESLLLGENLEMSWVIKNYLKLYENVFFKQTFFNSIIVTLISISLSLSVALPASFYVVRHRRVLQSKNKSFDFILLLAYMLPEFLFIIPMYAIYQKIGLYDTHFGLALLYQVHVLPFSIWMLSNFFEKIPIAISEVAKIDGASYFQILTKIYIPLSLPGIGAVSILNAIWIWNELAIALGLTVNKAQTITVGITSFRGYISIDYGAMAAASVVAIVPMLIAALFVQKYIIGGLTAGAVK